MYSSALEAYLAPGMNKIVRNVSPKPALEATREILGLAPNTVLGGVSRGSLRGAPHCV